MTKLHAILVLTLKITLSSKPSMQKKRLIRTLQTIQELHFLKKLQNVNDTNQYAKMGSRPLIVINIFRLPIPTI